eukprot:1956294-Alexandrium_andersonii.AAC.1
MGPPRHAPLDGSGICASRLRIRRGGLKALPGRPARHPLTTRTNTPVSYTHLRAHETSAHL